jgi:hypothetical protein
MRALLALAVLGFSVLAGPPPGDPGTREHDKASELVKQFGDPKFATREAAAKKVLEMGASALIALQDGAKSNDEEVRTRCAALIPKIKLAEWNRRADAYLADVDGKQKHDVPLLAEYEKSVGKPDAAARKLYADMLRSNGELLELVATDPKRGKAAHLIHAGILLTQAYQPSPFRIAVPDLAAVLLIDAASGPQLDSGAETTLRLLHSFNALGAKNGSDFDPELRRLVVRWAEVRVSVPPPEPRYRILPDIGFQFIGQTRFPEFVPVLVKIAHDRKAGGWAMRAIYIVALYDGKEAAEALEQIMLDKSLVFKAIDRAGKESELRFGDYALAASLRMHNRKYADFELMGQEWLSFENDVDARGYDFLGFASEDARKKAIQKWKDEVIGNK